ncbi:glycosyltransferase family 4 protein [Prochlorococcus marinus]|uniref:glycosyltransferase family 4 protein n=1 Tax=Prochlorococcus marinus TaxID=1219 RepID=UPI0022B55DD3|nr:glycosyltransferase family 4 protein [Prochlorococcus marinus]
MTINKSISRKYPAALILPGDAFDTERYQLMGRRVAGKEFAKGIVNNLYQGEELDILVNSVKEKEYLNTILNPYLIKNTSLNIHTKISKFNLNEIENIHIPGPDLEKWSAIRANYSPNKFSITGIIHTLCSNKVINGFKEYIFGGLESWDALVCTSSCGREVVNRTIDFFHESFERKYNIKLTKKKRPELYTIPLAVNDITYDISLTRKEKRLKARNKLGISKDAIVILFLGRLSFHGKAHPLAIYRSISKLSTEIKDKQIVLLECGTFANETIEKLYNSLIFSFRNLTIKRVGGIEQATEEAKIDSLNAANIFISLSDNIQETFGLTVIEAMAAELPCIVSDWNGYKDLVKENETGYLIPTKYAVGSKEAINHIELDYKIEKINFDYMIGLKSMKTVIDENALNDKLKFLIDNKEIRENMGYKSKQRWKELFSWQVVSHQYRKLWLNLKERRDSYNEINTSIRFHPSIDYIFKDYSTAIYNEKELFVDSDSTKPEMLLFPLHSKLVEIITSKKTKQIIELIKQNKSIKEKELEIIGIEKDKRQEVMALIEKLGIAKNKSKRV